MRLTCAFLLGFLFSCPAPAAPTPHHVCEVVPGPPVRVRVWRVVGEERRSVGPELVYRHRGKMASAADLDEDGALDLLVLVHKSTRYDPRLAWRPFVYTLGDDEWVPKWLGSRVGRPLLEASFVRTPKGVRLLTVEQFGEGETGFTLYHWRGFGFWGEWTGEPCPAFSGLQVHDGDGDGVDEISVCIGERRQTYRYRNGGYAPAEEPREEGK